MGFFKISGLRRSPLFEAPRHWVRSLSFLGVAQALQVVTSGNRGHEISPTKKKRKSLKNIIYWYCLIPPRMGNLMNPDRTVPLWFLQEIQQGIFISLPCPDQQWTTMSETKQEHSMGILLGFSMWDRISWKWHGATLFRVSIDMLWSLFVIKS